MCVCVVLGVLCLLNAVYALPALVSECAFRAVVLRLISSCLLHRKLFYESPGGNQVDGLPPAANTKPGVIGRRVGPYKSGVNRPLA